MLCSTHSFWSLIFCHIYRCESQNSAIGLFLSSSSFYLGCFLQTCCSDRLILYFKSLARWGSKHLCASVAIRIKKIVTGSRLADAHTASRDVHTKLSLSQLFPVVWLEAFWIWSLLGGAGLQNLVSFTMNSSCCCSSFFASICVKGPLIRLEPNKWHRVIHSGKWKKKKVVKYDIKVHGGCWRSGLLNHFGSDYLRLEGPLPWIPCCVCTWSLMGTLQCGSLTSFMWLSNHEQTSANSYFSLWTR